MHAFKDGFDRKWELRITVATVQHVRDATGVNLYALIENSASGLAKLLSDPVEIIKIVFTICEKQIVKVGISPEEFADGFGGDTLEAAADAFVQELVDFFPNRTGREALKRLLTKGREMSDEALSRGMREIEAATLDSLLEKSSGTSGT